MAALIVDIETVGMDWDSLPRLTRTALTQWIDVGDFTPVERQQKYTAVRSRLALSPFTAHIVAMSVFDTKRQTGAVYYTTTDPVEQFTLENFTFKSRSEAELLTEFWDGATHYEVFVTFNGRSFTMPFLYHRSMMQHITPSVRIANHRYLTQQVPPYHIDLLHEFSFQGALTHRPSLSLLCGAYGITHPSLLGGEEVAEAYAAGRSQYIAEKSMHDVEAMTQLYVRWEDHLAPESFLQSVEIT